MQNLIINGSGNASGGEYEKISIRGEATVMDDVLVTGKVSIYGEGTFLGDVKANLISVMGQASVHGKLQVKELSVYGQMTADKEVSAKISRIRGLMEARKNLTGEVVDNKGALKVAGSVTVDRFVSKGFCEIEELLSADEIHLSMKFHDCKIKEIGAGKITVSRMLLPFNIKEDGAILESTVIEADEISLEHTKAEVVRGNHVRIGTGCEIALVEYRDEIIISPNATVLKQVQG